MSNFAIEFTSNFLPEENVPFYSSLEELFCARKEQIQDLSMHYPNVIRCIRDIILNYGRNLVKEKPDGAIAGVEMRITNEIPAIDKCLEITSPELKDKTLESLQIAALYHDIGKIIRQANHPRLGVNILRNMNNEERSKLVNGLVMKDDKKNSNSNEHRFSLLCSIVDHHDKFGVVSTGEASLAIFSDILYFRSDEKTIAGIKKNITSVMLLSLADIAAVCTADKEKQKRAAELVSGILKDRALIQSDDYKELCDLWASKDSFLGLSYDKVNNILDDWQELIKAIEKETVLGDRTKLREYLIRLDQNPHRTIKRIIRIIKECCYTTNCNSLLLHISETDIESTLVSFFGAHQFQDFCIKFAYIVKMDYGLKFFKGILCACIRDKLHKLDDSIEKGEWLKLNQNEKDKLDNLTVNEMQNIIKRVSKIFINVISGIILRYSSILDLKIESAYRFGLQMRTLTEDDNVRERILQYLCSADENMDHVALTWIADEVTFWSMD